MAHDITLNTCPKGWNRLKVNQICSITSGSTPSRNEAGNFKGNILWVTSGELKKRFINSTIEQISEEAAKRSNLKMYEPGTVVIAIYGLEAEGIRGTASIVGKKCTISQACMAFTDFKSVSNDYFYYWYLNNGQIIGLRFAQGTKQQNLSTDIVGNLPICFPPLAEQKKIAAVLSTQDRVIELKERRLEEKRRQKKYLMQRVLHGKWPVITLHDLVVPLSEQVGNKKIEVLSISANIGFVNQSEKFGKDISGRQYSKYLVIHKGDFAYNKGNSKSYPQGCIYPLEDRETGAVPNVFIPFRLKHGHDYRFFKYLFESGYLNAQLYKRINSGVRDDGLLNLKDEEFFKCLIPVPPVKEQIQIANILSTADRELSLLRADLEQERQKKKALMQRLLSGLVRVNAKGGEADGAV